MDLDRVLIALDRWGITIANHRISAWTVLVALVVIAGVYIVAKLLTRFSRWTIGKSRRLDGTQRLLSEKLARIASSFPRADRTSAKWRPSPRSFRRSSSNTI